MPSTYLHSEPLEILIDAIPDAAVAIDEQEIITDWNYRAEELFGWKRAFVIGMKFPDIVIAPRHRENFCSHLEKPLQLEWNQRASDHFEISGLKKNQNEFPLEIWTIPIKRDGIFGLCLIVRDNSGKNAPWLQTQLKKVESIVENAIDGIITLNERFEIESWNQASEKMFGYSSQEIFGKSISKIISTPTHHQDDTYIAKYLQTDQARIIGLGREEVLGKRKDGTTFPLDLGVSEFRVGSKRNYTAILRDISEFKQMTDSLRLARDAANSATQAKSAFLANMSHEIRTPLGAVMGFSDLLIDPKVSLSDKLNYVAAIKRNGELLSNIINDILDLSKVEAGKMEIETREVAIEEILNDVSSLLSLKAKEKGLNYALTCDPLVPKIIRTDPIRLRQILFNIVGNAVKFTDHGSVEVVIKMTKGTAGLTKLSFIVRDTGPGISTDHVGKLFQPFSQVSNTSKRRTGGTGLGLVLAKNLARLLGGDVILSESIIGKGSAFAITIDPRPIKAWESKIIKPHKKTQSSFSTDDQPRLDGIKVLLVEDSLDNQFLIHRFLELAGAQIEIAENGKVALDKITGAPYDVILMDLQMPVMDGYEATRELRKGGIKIPIIALTAHAQMEERDKCLASGFNNYVNKPIDRYALLKLIASYRAPSH